ncbi:hypothetical protein O3G_MSEX010528 [Manduca sexta]|uniref:Ketoreductase domain-containing protein n=1 Tax=Manduca sexta TaxID=7130 RepID=A0A921ZHG7_MANSE|nr:hypothetical protein O3G_MSEX010528 [Manduca sexta]
MSFANKVVLVTGASSGIGAAAAILFGREGADLTIVGRDDAKLAKVAEECGKFGKKPLIISADVTKDDEVTAIVEQTIKVFGKLDVLINNAGMIKPDDISHPSFMQIFDDIMNTNMRAVALLTNLATPHLKATKGSIVNVSSVAATQVSMPRFASYKTSKAALNHFTRCVALELAPHGVRVNSISPGPVSTDLFDRAGMSTALTVLKGATALDRVSDPEEIAEMILLLASDKAKGVTGSDYVIDNGILLK